MGKIYISNEQVTVQHEALGTGGYAVDDDGDGRVDWYVFGDYPAEETPQWMSNPSKSELLLDWSSWWGYLPPENCDSAGLTEMVFSRFSCDYRQTHLPDEGPPAALNERAQIVLDDAMKEFDLLIQSAENYWDGGSTDFVDDRGRVVSASIIGNGNLWFSVHKEGLEPNNCEDELAAGQSCTIWENKSVDYEVDLDVSSIPESLRQKVDMWEHTYDECLENPALAGCLSETISAYQPGRECYDWSLEALQDRCGEYTDEPEVPCASPVEEPEEPTRAEKYGCLIYTNELL